MTRNIMLSVIMACILAGLSVFSIPSEGAEKIKKEGAVVVSEGKFVKVNYTLKVDGKILEASTGRRPLQFKAGSHQVIPGFEKAIIGMKAGQKKSFKLSPEQGYGPRDPKAVKSIPKTQMPPEVKPKAGMVLDNRDKNGRRVPVTVVAVKKDAVVIDYNHPLAGKTLNYEVEVLEVK